MTLAAREVPPVTPSPLLVVTNGELRIENSVVLTRSETPIDVIGAAARLVGTNVRFEGFGEAREVALNAPQSALQLRTVSPSGGTIRVGSGRRVGATSGGELVLEGFTLEGLAAVAVSLRNGASATLTDGLIASTAPDARVTAGYGLQVTAGARATLERVRFQDGRHAAVVVDGAASELMLNDSTVAGTTRGPVTNDAIGIVVQNGAKATVTGSTIEEVEGPGIWVAEGASLKLTGSLVQKTEAVGVLVVDATATIEGNTINDVEQSRASGYGIGVVLWSVGGTAAARIDGNVIRDYPRAGIHLQNGSIAASIMGNDLSGGTDYSTLGNNVVFHDGVIALEVGNGASVSGVASGIEMEGNCIDESGGSHLRLYRSTATLAGNHYTAAYAQATAGNAIRQDGCGDLTPVAVTGETLPPAVDAVVLCMDRYDLLTHEFAFALELTERAVTERAVIE